MQPSEESLRSLAEQLGRSMSVTPAERRQAEDALRMFEKQPGFSSIVLSLISLDSVGLPIRQAAAVAFKNYIKYHWQLAEDESDPGTTWVISEADRNNVKGQIVTLMVHTPGAIRKQLSEALSIVSNYDFPLNWGNLLPELVSKLQTTDFNTVNGILQTAHSIFKRYRYTFKSKELIEEIKYVLGVFQKPLLDLFQATAQAALGSGQDANTLRVLFDNLRVMARIFYSLCSQDLPEFFEDHMSEWMGAFDTLLVYENKTLEAEEEDEAGPVHKLQAAICENLNMYMEKYEEEFAPFLQRFVADVWNLLMKASTAPAHDLLVVSAIRFLTSVSKSVHFALFKDPDTLRNICEKIIIPNVKFREVDEELFEDNPAEYIRRDIEGSDSDTRRRCACELVKALCIHYEDAVTAIFSAYIAAMIQEYAANPSANWASKDAAIYLLLALAVKSSTSKLGTTSTNQLVNVMDFFTSQILPELQSPTAGSPVIKADAIKFVSTFRNQLSKEVYLTVMPLLIQLLTSRTFVVHTYAAACIERMLTVKDHGTLRFDRGTLQPVLPSLLTNLFAALSLPGSQENDYIMKTIMRVTGVAQGDVAPFLQQLVAQLNGILGSVCANPKNPSFNHYLFETVAALVHYICAVDPKAVAVFEELLFPPFQTVLQMDVTEFSPYVFQILAQLLECSPPPVSARFMALFPPLLMPVLWERPGNVPALVRLVQAYLDKGSAQIVAGRQLEPVLGVFQKLIASKANDHEGFYLISTVVQTVPTSDLAPYIGTVFQLILTRLQHNKTLKFIKSLIVFLSVFVIIHGGPALIQPVDALQPKLFYMLLEQVWLANVQKVSGTTERKICAVALARLVADTPAMLSDTYRPLWGPTLNAAVQLFEAAEDDTVTPEDEDALLEIDETPGFGYTAAFSQLHYAPRPERDPVASVSDPKLVLAVSVHRTVSANPPLLALAQSSLPPPSIGALSKYLAAANLPPLA